MISDYNPHILGQRLQELRTKNNLSQQFLGDLLYVHRNTISHYERGTRTPNLQILIQLADYFDVSTDYLLGREKSERR